MPVANGAEAKMTRPGYGLSSRILLLTVGFILIGEVLIFIPSIARFRLVYLEERIAASHIAVVPTVGMPSFHPDEATAQKLLHHAGVRAITLRDPRARVMLGSETYAEFLYDLREAGPLDLIIDACETLIYGGDRVVKILDEAPMEAGTVIEVLVHEEELVREMRDYAIRILTLTLVLSIIVGLFIFLSLRRMIVAPLRELTKHIAVFHKQPENDVYDMPATARRDEIGVVQHALRDMQASVRQSLRQKTRLAGLGEAVSKISHDLRNILSSAALISDRLEGSADPQVQSVAPRLIESLNRAIRLSNTTLEYAKSGMPRLKIETVGLRQLIDDAAQEACREYPKTNFRQSTAKDLTLPADRDQLNRAFVNLIKNAAQALNARGEIKVQTTVSRQDISIALSDNGPGVPDKIRDRIFEPFTTSAKTEGSGLGLAIAHEILRAHGGDIILSHSNKQGTEFAIRLPGPIKRV